MSMTETLRTSVMSTACVMFTLGAPSAGPTGTQTSARLRPLCCCGA